MGKTNPHLKKNWIGNKYEKGINKTTHLRNILDNLENRSWNQWNASVWN